MAAVSGLDLQQAVALAEIAPRSQLLWPRRAAAASRIAMFGATIENTTQAEAARALAARADAHRPTRIVFANAHVVNAMAADPTYAAIVAGADRVYADGSGMAVAARLAGTPLADNMNGTDLFPLLCREALARGQTVFLLGARPGVAAAAAATLARLGLGAAVAGTHHGYFEPGSAEETAVIDAVNASGASIVLVAMGVPLQDQWIAANERRLSAPVLAGVGGLFDFFSGQVSRAPHLFRAVGMEWVWRLALEPRRMAERYLIGNANFLALAARAALAQRWHNRDRRNAAPTSGLAFGNRPRTN